MYYTLTKLYQHFNSINFLIRIFVFKKIMFTVIYDICFKYHVFQMSRSFTIILYRNSKLLISFTKKMSYRFAFFMFLSLLFQCRISKCYTVII